MAHDAVARGALLPLPSARHRRSIVEIFSFRLVFQKNERAGANYPEQAAPFACMNFYWVHFLALQIGIVTNDSFSCMASKMLGISRSFS